MSFEITLSERGPVSHPLRHGNDVMIEVLVDYDDGRPGQSLGWLTSMHDIFTGKLLVWHLVDENCDPLPGSSDPRHKTKKSAIAAASEFMRGLESRRREAGGMQ